MDAEFIRKFVFQLCESLGIDDEILTPEMLENIIKVLTDIYYAGWGDRYKDE